MLSLILDPMLQRDAALYLSLAERWQETGEYVQTMADGTVVPPFPLYTIMKLMNWGLDSEIAGRSIALFLGAMIPVLGYIVSYLIFNDVLVSGISTVLFIFHPTLISYSIQPLRENYYLFFLGLTIVAGIKGIKDHKIKDWGLCGVFLSFSIFSRYESMEMLIVFPLLLLILFFSRKTNLKKTATLLFAFFATNILTSGVLLSITDFDLSFITKISEYKKRMIEQNNVRDYFQINP